MSWVLGSQNDNINTTNTSQLGIMAQLTSGRRHGRVATASWLLCLLGHALLAAAATVTYDFNITWVTANPDGMADRPVIGINGQWPIPTIHVDVGDRLVVNVLNSLGNQSTSLHFHGLYMHGANYMDGPVAVTQCPIQPGERFTYNFTVSIPTEFSRQHKLTHPRSTNRALTGTTRTCTANTRTACAGPSSSTTPSSPSPTCTTRRSSCLSRTGTTTRCTA